MSLTAGRIHGNLLDKRIRPIVEVKNKVKEERTVQTDWELRAE